MFRKIIYSGFRLIGTAIYLGQITNNRNKSIKYAEFASLIWDTTPFNRDSIGDARYDRYGSENDTSLELQHVRNYEEFACIDDRFQCYNENEDFLNAIVEQIVTKYQ